MNKPKIIPYAVCFDGGFPPFLRMYDVNEDNILLLLLFFGVVAIHLLLFNYYSRTPTQQLVLDGFIFLPAYTRVFFCRVFVHTTNSQHQKLNSQKHIFNQTLYIRLFCCRRRRRRRRRRPRAFGVIEGQR